MKSLEIKKYSATRYANMRACDQKYYSFSADWSQPQKKAVVDAACRWMTARLALMAGALEEGGAGWGTKPDTIDLVHGVMQLMQETKRTNDDQENAFIAYQLERYTFRAWYRGTKEQRDAALKKLADAGFYAPGKEPKAEAKPKAKAKAEPKAEAKPKVAVKAKASTKKAAPKSAPVTNDGKVVVHEVEVDDPVAAQLITYLGTFLQDELSSEQKRSFVTGLCAMLKN